MTHMKKIFFALCMLLHYVQASDSSENKSTASLLHVDNNYCSPHCRERCLETTCCLEKICHGIPTDLANAYEQRHTYLTYLPSMCYPIDDCCCCMTASILCICTRNIYWSKREEPNTYRVLRGGPRSSTYIDESSGKRMYRQATKHVKIGGGAVCLQYWSGKSHLDSSDNCESPCITCATWYIKKDDID